MSNDEHEFEVLVDTSLAEMVDDSCLSPVHNKFLKSITNEYEDGVWRYTEFQNFVWDNIAETSLSYKERECLIDKRHSTLVAAAKNLRLTDSEKSKNGKDHTKGSELAEVVLYGIMKNYFGALPVVPKIFYKQNPQDNAKGADSVHLVLDEDDFTVWFGEAKFYNSLGDARLTEIVNSVKKSLATDKIKKENSIMTGVGDIDHLEIEDALREKIRTSLSNRNTIDKLKPKINIPIFILHECQEMAHSESLSEGLKEKIIDIHKDAATRYFRKQLGMADEIPGYELIKFHIILFPVPDKSSIVEKFIKNVEHYKSQ